VKRVLHIQLYPLLSGVQNVSLQILDNLDPAEWEVYVISQPNGPLVEEVRRRGYTHLAVSTLRRQLSPLDFLAFIRIYFLCRKYRFDIVHTHSSKTGFLGRIAARLAGVPKVIHTVHGFSFHPNQPLPFRWLYMLLEAVASHFADRIVFVNHSERRTAIRLGLVPREKAITIYNGAEIREPVSTRRLFPPEQLVVGWSGRFSKQKNPVQTVEIACLAATANPRLSFVFVGDGELRATCQHRVASYGLSNRIQFPGWQRDIHEWLSGFDVFLLFSRWEGLPLSILEAMSMGLPIIASKISGNEELIDNRNGWLISLRDGHGLEHLLHSLPDNREQLHSMGMASRERVRNEFDIQRFRNQYLELYRS
jgi:glycosyltransferase involved in cell wall biosynthesis